MGQLEKYGLYVMCLVIFLILGVSLWDVGDPATPGKQTPSMTEVASKPGPSSAAPGVEDLAAMDSLFKATPRDGKPPAKPPSGEGPRAPDANAKDASAGKSPPPGTEPKPAPDSKRPTHKVRADETFESIAKTRLGSAALRTEIERLNPGVKPTRLHVGQEIVLPSAADLAPRADARTDAPADAKAPAPLAGSDRLYTIKRGDTFERIATTQLGDKRRVEELRALNPGVEDTKLREGKSLKLPKK